MEQTFSEKKIFRAKCYLCKQYYSIIHQYNKLSLICKNNDCIFYTKSKIYSFVPTFIFIEEENNKFKSCEYYMPFDIEGNWYLIDGKEKFIDYKGSLIKIIDHCMLESFDKHFVPTKLIQKKFIPINIKNIEEDINSVKNKLTNYIAYV